MLILSDNGTPRTLARYQIDHHTITEARARGWEELENGALLTMAEASGFEVLVTTDKNLRYQQNLTSRNDLHRCSGKGPVGSMPDSHPGVRVGNRVSWPEHKFGFLVLPIARLLLGESRLIIVLTGCDQVENASRQFVSGCGDCLRCPQVGPHSAVEISQRRLASM